MMKKLIFIFSLIGVFAFTFVGVYLLLTITYLKVVSIPEIAQFDSQPQGEVLSDSSIVLTEVDKALIIPKINLNEVIYEEGKISLDKGIWHRFPERGNPEKGGNFILTGHRFNFGFTPEQTRRKSPLYNVDSLRVGDQIQIKWQKDYYDYEIFEIKEVPKTATEIEDPTKNHILTLYTCTLLGDEGPRVLIKARRV